MKAANPPKRITSTIINALNAGVVPRIGLEYIAVGRDREIEALLRDTEVVADGGASFRFIVGKYGSGKSFLLQTIRNYAMEKGFAVADADLSPERRFSGTKGQGLATYRELLKNLSTKTRPDGGALPLVLEKWISGIKGQAASESGAEPRLPEFDGFVRRRVFEAADSLEGMVNGFDFARAVLAYYSADNSGDDAQKSNVLRWFRGEYQTKTEAKNDLGINFIVTDETWYDFLKVLSAFMVRAGYSGLFLIIDELVNIFKIPNSASRQSNYEKILTMYNDALQGRASHIGFLLGGTPQCIEDRYRGVFSYEALRSRLAEGHFSGHGANMLSPIIRLEMLGYDEMYVLIEKLMGMHAQLFDYPPCLSHDELLAFLNVEYNRVGASTHMTPREIIRDFIEFLNILYQNPGTPASDVLSGGKFAVIDEPKDEFREFDI